MKTIRLLSLLGLSLFFAGCQAPRLFSSSLAVEEVNAVPVERVHEAAIHVFTEEGYQVVQSQKYKIIFSREGTLNERLQYGSYTEAFTIRVEVSLSPQGSEYVILRANAFAIRGEAERGAIRLTKLSYWPYQELLHSVKKKVEKGTW
jgi:hypothetical protein